MVRWVTPDTRHDGLGFRPLVRVACKWDENGQYYLWDLAKAQLTRPSDARVGKLTMRTATDWVTRGHLLHVLWMVAYCTVGPVQVANGTSTAGGKSVHLKRMAQPETPRYTKTTTTMRFHTANSLRHRALHLCGSSVWKGS